MEFIKKIKLFKSKKIGLIKKINTLELENETLKEEIKNGLYKKLIDMTNAEVEIEKLKESNKKLRKQLKEVKENVKNAKI